MTDAMNDHAAKSSDAKPRGGRSAVEAVDACIRCIEEREPQVRAFVDFAPARAREQARALDRVEPAERGPLHGVPVAVKEVFDVAGMRCGWGTPIHRDRVPTRDSAVVRALEAAGAAIVGTTVSTEYAMARPGPTRNPFDPERTPGASSSGSAAAVGAGMVPIALGSQTIGSIIRPAAYCGVFGFKPTWGTIDSDGAMSLSEALDHPGILAATLDDLRTAFGVLRRDSGGDRTRPRVNLGMITVHVLARWGPEPYDETSVKAIDGAAATFRSRGMTAISASLPDDLSDEEDCLTRILCHDMARHHGNDRDRCGDLMSDRLRNMIDRGRDIDGVEYEAARQRATEIRGRLEAIIGADGLFMTAATIGVAPLAADGTGSRSPQRIWTLAGMPAITVPVGMAGGLPIGVQLVGARGRDDLVLAAAEILATPQGQGRRDGR